MEDPILLCAYVLGTVLRTGGIDSQDGGKIDHGSPILVLGSHKQSDDFLLRDWSRNSVLNWYLVQTSKAWLIKTKVDLSFKKSFLVLFWWKWKYKLDFQARAGQATPLLK